MALKFVVVRGALPHTSSQIPRDPEAHAEQVRWVITLALRVIRGCTARQSEIWAPQKHVGAASTSGPGLGVSPTEPRSSGWNAGLLQRRTTRGVCGL